jgi:FOG: GAF domain
MNEQNAAYQSLERAHAHPAGEHGRDAKRSAPMLDTSAERDFDELAQLAAHVCRAPLALVVMADGAGRGAKAAAGLRGEDATVQFGLCEITLGQDEPLTVGNTLSDERFADDPLVAAGARCGSYAGVRLVSQRGDILGALCVMDVQPREWVATEAEDLRMLARQIVAQIELRRVEAELTRSGEALEHSLREGERIAQALSESEARFHSLADSAPVMIWTAGPYATPTFFQQVVAGLHRSIAGAGLEGRLA